MIWDLVIILGYFMVILVLGILRRTGADASVEEFFLKSRSLRWPSIAFSTIATNIQAGHFLGMAGSAYLYGLAQANLEIGAITGILIAAFIFVPLYLRRKVITITQFLEERLGPQVALGYSILMIVLYSLLFLGTALFWGAYAINALFEDAVRFISSDPMTRIFVIAVCLGAFSALYTYLGGLGAVVRTDIAQFVLLLFGGSILTFLAIKELGGWPMLYEKTGSLMHLHLPADHPTIPWPALIGMFLLNLNYWGVNQIILQRALAAKNLYHAQAGLIVGGFLKYFMAVIIVIPGIALVGILQDTPLSDPDLAYPTLAKSLLPAGLRGIVLCGLFASLMSTIDSIYNSVATLWSIDIYKRYIRPQATDRKMVRMGKSAILFTMVAGILFTYVNIYVKFENPTFALTHWFNEVSYFVKNGFVFLIICAVFLSSPSKKLVLYAFIGSVFATPVLKWLLPAMNYFNRSTVVILLTTAIVAVPSIIRNGWTFPRKNLVIASTANMGRVGFALLSSFILCHVIFH